MQAVFKLALCLGAIALAVGLPMEAQKKYFVRKLQADLARMKPEEALRVLEQKGFFKQVTTGTGSCSVNGKQATCTASMTVLDHAITITVVMEYQADTQGLSVKMSFDGGATFYDAFYTGNFAPLHRCVFSPNYIDVCLDSADAAITGSGFSGCLKISFLIPPSEVVGIFDLGCINLS